MRIYLLSTAVAPLGSGLGGGVESDDLDGLTTAVDQIDRARCRAWVESHYTLAHYGTALNDWLRALAAQSTDSRGTVV